MPNVGSYARAKCPYFKRERGNAVVCEGATDGSVLLLAFDDTERREAWQACRCEQLDYAQRCPIAAMLEKKYEGTNRDPNRADALDLDVLIHNFNN